MPNGVYLVGGNQTLGVNDDYSEQSGGLEEVAPGVVICTGANACGKVGSTLLPFSRSASETLGAQSVYLKQVNPPSVPNHTMH